MSPQRFIIGDIHGCYRTLCDLLDAAGLCDDDEIIAVGDLIDRGPEPGRVIEFFRRRPRACSALGNHEVKHIEYLAGRRHPGVSQLEARIALATDYPESVRFFEGLSPLIERPEVWIAHAAIDLGRPFDAQDPRVLSGVKPPPRGDRDWYEGYRGERPIVVGHRIYQRNDQPLVYRDRVYGLDTGCCHGGRLTGLLIPSFRLVSVASRWDDWSALREHAPRASWPRRRRPPTWSELATLLEDDATRWPHELSPLARESLSTLWRWCNSSIHRDEPWPRGLLRAFFDGSHDSPEALLRRLKRPSQAVALARHLD